MGLVFYFIFFQSGGNNTIGDTSSGFSPFYLIMLLCPLLHLFMMRGHGSNCHNNSETSQNSTDEKNT
ncbi:MAG: DUF2933 domain-containing protein [Bacillota bacterium]|nr:DUF2933 domain-containing protein [Bacillota bacterium]